MQNVAVALKIFAFGPAHCGRGVSTFPGGFGQATGKRFAVGFGVIRQEEARGGESWDLKPGENLLALSHAAAGATWEKVVRSMAKVIADQRGYGGQQVKLSLDQIVTQAGQPSVYGGNLALFRGQMIGLLEPLLVVAVIPASPAEGRSQPRHVILQLGLPVPSAFERQLVHRLESCLGNPGALSELLATRSGPDFAGSLLTAVRAPGRWDEGSARLDAKEDGRNPPEEVLSETQAHEINYNLVQVWIERAEKNASRCYVCMRIARGNREAGDFASLRICGVEFNPESQISHLSRCVGKGSQIA